MARAQRERRWRCAPIRGGVRAMACALRALLQPYLLVVRVGCCRGTSTAPGRPDAASFDQGGLLSRCGMFSPTLYEPTLPRTSAHSSAAILKHEMCRCGRSPSSYELIQYSWSCSTRMVAVEPPLCAALPVIIVPPPSPGRQPWTSTAAAVELDAGLAAVTAAF